MTKYRAIRTTVDGITFDSRKEAFRYQDLKFMEKTGKILELEIQPSFELSPSLIYEGKKERAIVYRADFSYRIPERKRRIVEDVKGFKTPVYKLKRHLFLIKFGDDLDFIEI